MCLTFRLLFRQAVAFGCAVVASSHAADRAAAQADDRAKVILLGDQTAAWFLDLDPPPPPKERVLVAGDQQGGVFAFVLGRDTKEALTQLSEIRIAGEIQGCERGGVTCCDAGRKTYVLDAEYQEERFWLPLGETCQGYPPEDGVADGPPVGEPDAAVVDVDSELMKELAKYGVTYPFMTLAEESGNGRILVDRSQQSGAPGLPTPFRHAILNGDELLIIPANHVIPQPKTMPSVSYCKKEDGDRCNADGLHWWRWVSTDQEWWRIDKCKCPS
jgi:hypothetical protein